MSALTSTSGDPARAREFQFMHADFMALRTLVKQMTGINLAESKEELVYGRISRRLRTLGMHSFSEYRHLLKTDDAELTEFCNAMTTNLTAFFREGHHFDYLREAVLLPRTKNVGASRRLRIWSAACSSGEEPYSIAMTVRDAIPDWRRWDIKILATDIDSHILGRARRGVYAPDRIKGLSRQNLQRHFSESGVDSEARVYEVVPELASAITFRQLNLMLDLPMAGPFDAIFCRNVVIYFDKETQRRLFARIARLQRPGDLLFLGHSESLFKVSTDYTLIGKTVYRRT